MRAYHDDTKVKLPAFMSFERLKTGVDTKSRQQGMTVHKTLLGAKGVGLYQMLAEAQKFVTGGDGRNEFLMLKFDKCSNWHLVARACIDTLGDAIYKKLPDTKCLNECTLHELKGSVIVLFSKDGCQACGIDASQRRQQGILQWKNLYKSSESTPGGFVSDFPGLQYYGKGGVSKGVKGDSQKIGVNAVIQTGLAKGRGAFQKESGSGDKKVIKTGHHDSVDPKIVGLLYWTTTGASLRGIEARNTKMWSQPNQQLLVQATGLAMELVPSSVDPNSGSGATVVKRFMPNIVMVDFVDTHKGKLVKELNTRSAAQIHRVIDEAFQI